MDRCGYGMAGGYLTDVLHSSEKDHQERATELRQPSRDVEAAYGAVILRIHGDNCTNSNLRYFCFFFFVNNKICSVNEFLNLWFGEHQYVELRTWWCVSCIVVHTQLMYCRYNSSKWNVLCFGKSQPGVRFCCSRLTLEVWCIALDKVCSKWTYALKPFSTRKIYFWVHFSVWLRPCNALHTVMDWTGT